MCIKWLQLILPCWLLEPGGRFAMMLDSQILWVSYIGVALQNRGLGTRVILASTP